MALTDFAPLWDDRFRRGELDPGTPDAAVLEFLGSLGPGAGRTLLDAGCGTGRHLLLAMERGFQVFGADASRVALDLLRTRLSERNRRAELRVARLANLPFDDGMFDAVLCIDAVHHGRKVEVERGVAELLRVLAPGGGLLCTLASRAGAGWCVGEEVEPGTFVPPEGPEAGIPCHPWDRQELTALFGATLVEVREVGPDDRPRLLIRAQRR